MTDVCRFIDRAYTVDPPRTTACVPTRDARRKPGAFVEMLLGSPEEAEAFVDGITLVGTGLGDSRMFIRNIASSLSSCRYGFRPCNGRLLVGQLDASGALITVTRAR